MSILSRISHYFIESAPTIKVQLEDPSSRPVIKGRKPRHAELGFTAGLLPLDFLGILLSVYISNLLRSSLDILPVGDNRFTNLDTKFLWWYFPILAIVFASQGLYILFRTRNRLYQLFRVTLACAVACMILFVVTLLGRTPFASLHYPDLYIWASQASLLTVLYLWIASAVILTILRSFYRELINTLNVLAIGTKNVIIVGDNETGAVLTNTIINDQSLGYQLIGIISTEKENGNSNLVIGKIDNVESIIAKELPDQIIMADLELRTNTIINLIDIANEYGVEFTFAPNLFEVLASNVTFDGIGGIPLLNLKRTSLDGWGKIFKRVFDLVISLILIIILSPLIIIFGVMIKLFDGGPIFITMERVSRGQLFKLIKLRSMHVGAHLSHEKLKNELNERNDGPLMKISHDPRVTPVGRFIRKTRIDELPQLLNVFKGDMSLIGPRPHQPNEVALYQKHHKKVLAIKPGLTGPAQISGSSSLSFEDEVRIDTDYIEHWSFWRDLEIFIKTPYIILFKDKSGC